MEDIQVRISELPGADPLNGTELIPMFQNGTTKIRSSQSLVLEGGLQDHIDNSDPHPQYAFRVKNNLTATTDPTVNDDITEGYEPTSRWVNTVTEEFFICVTNTAGSANWQQQTLTIDELGSAALANVGSGNGLDADLLDGQHGSFYQNASNLNSGILPSARFNNTSHGSRSGGTLHSTATTSVNGFMSAADKTKLDGVETGAQVNTVNTVNTKVGDVVLVTDDISEDASPSNLWFTQSRARGSISASGDLSYNSTTGVINFDETYSTPNELLSAVLTVDGTGSGLDADLLDGQHGTFYRNASNLNAGTISDARLPDTITSDITGNAATATQLETARTINGTSFNGAANITTANWGTSRTLTIGATGKSVNGSANVTWTLPEIGVNDGTLTLTTSGIATGSQTFSANQGTNATFTVNVPGTNLGQSRNATSYTITSSTGNNTALLAASTTNAGVMSSVDKTKLDGIQAGAQVNVGTNLGQSRNATSYTVTSSTGTNTTLAAATTTNAGVMSAADKTKLDGVETGAQPNAVTSVNGKTGAVSVTKADVGLGSVRNVPSYSQTEANTNFLGKTDVASGGVKIIVPDERNLVEAPGDLQARAVSFAFKLNTTVDNPPATSSPTYSHVMNVVGWDATGGSGGWPSQWSFGNGLAFRQGTSATTWGAWREIYHSGNFDPATKANTTGTYAIRATSTTKADVGLSGIPNTNGSTANYLRGDGSWVTPPNTTYSAGTGISLSGTTFSLTDERYTLTEKNKLAGIQAGAQVNVGTNLAMGGSANSRTITSSTGTNVTVPVATTSNAGFMSTGDKSKLNGIEAGAQVNVGTNLGYTASTRVLTSSTGTNVTLPEATTSTSGLMSSNDKATLESLTLAGIPSGVIAMWSGTTTSVPSGWALCDGTNGTPNLTNRFVVGAGDTYSVGDIGGFADAAVIAHTHTATSGKSGSHSHTGTTGSSGAHTHTRSINNSSSGTAHLQTSGGSSQGTITSANSAGAHSHAFTTNSHDGHTHTVTVNSTGESATNRNLPPYYALAYIMKT